MPRARSRQKCMLCVQPEPVWGCHDMAAAPPQSHPFDVGIFIIYPVCIIGHTLINTKPKTFLTRVPSWISHYFGLLILSVTRRTVKLKPWPTLPRAPHNPHIKHMPPDWARLVRGEDYDVLTYGQDTTFCGGTPTGHCPLMWGQNVHNKSRHSEK